MMAGAPEPHSSVLDSAMMEVDPKDGHSLTYQPQADLEPPTLTELKPVNLSTPYNIPVSFRNQAFLELEAAVRMGIIENARRHDGVHP